MDEENSCGTSGADLPPDLVSWAKHLWTEWRQRHGHCCDKEPSFDSDPPGSWQMRQAFGEIFGIFGADPDPEIWLARFQMQTSKMQTELKSGIGEGSSKVNGKTATTHLEFERSDEHMYVRMHVYLASTWLLQKTGNVSEFGHMPWMFKFLGLRERPRNRYSVFFKWPRVQFPKVDRVFPIHSLTISLTWSFKSCSLPWKLCRWLLLGVDYRSTPSNGTNLDPKMEWSS